MSLDKLAVIFLIIILPISVVLTKYTDVQTETLRTQLTYDERLDSSTVDALKAYQINAFNEDTSNNEQVQMRNISASANAFFTSLANNFNIQGSNKATLQDYVPALVFTMYDGYYMYSKFTNTITEKDYVPTNNTEGKIPSTYQNGDLLYGVLPFVSYSCRYKGYPSQDDDFVITYSLDNFITIQGIVNGQQVNDSGYLINGITVNETNKKITYNDDITITGEPLLEEYIAKNDEQFKYKYYKINGNKWYYENPSTDYPNGRWFSLLNGRKIYDDTKQLNPNGLDYSAYYYYKDAKEFTDRVFGEYNLAKLAPKYAYDSHINKEGALVEEKNGEFLKQGNKEAFIFDNSGIEEPYSNFNEHRQAVIRYTIEKNLSIAIKNYNHFKYGEGSDYYTDFQMPELKETEWDKILNNMTLISFLQGMPIGSKIYNGCAVVSNNKNNEVVTEDSIYIANTDNSIYYRPTYKDFNDTENLLGVLSIDMARKSLDPFEDEASVGTNYYYPKLYFASYDSITNPTKNVSINTENTDAANGNYAYNGNIYTYMKNDAKRNVAKAYFTALGRERYSKYMVFITDNISNRINNYNTSNISAVQGDLNGDGIVTKKDLKELEQVVHKEKSYDDNQKAAYDLNGDGIINMKDYNILQKIIDNNRLKVGDLNNNGQLDQNDYDILKNYLDKQIDLDEYQKDAADINNDGTVNSKDLIALENKLTQNNNSQEEINIINEDINNDETTVIKGDVNKDAKVDINDQNLLEQFLLGWVDFDDYQKQAADINGDGVINMKDSNEVKKIVVNNTPTVKKGDINNDGIVNMKDKNLLQNFISGYSEFDDYQKQAADINGDGTVNMRDYMYFDDFMRSLNS